MSSLTKNNPIKEKQLNTPFTKGIQKIQENHNLRAKNIQNWVHSGEISTALIDSNSIN